MFGRFFAILLVGMTGAGCAGRPSSDIAEFPSDPFSSTPAAATVGEYDLDSPIAALAANPTTAAVVDANIPGLLEDDNYPIFQRMSLNTVASLSGGRISTGTLQTIGRALKSLTVANAPN